MRIGFVCPTYKALELHSYTEKSILTFFATTPGGVVIVVDDGSGGFNREYVRRLAKLAPEPDRIVIEHFPRALGLTRSWNRGLSICADKQLDFGIAGNNDIIFPTRWYEGLIQLTAAGVALTGPLSNAPGVTAKGAQEITRHIQDYTLSDDLALLDSYSLDLLARNKGRYHLSPINGFFQFAEMSAWIKGKYDNQHFYKPVNFFTTTGSKNATPYTTLNEDELQARWHKIGLKSGIALSSFIFHYRAVSRGDKYKRGLWFRQHDQNTGV
jgi:glycosyltransferase involved in cell wall biosynthesis